MDTYQGKKTGIAYDPLMLEYHCEWGSIEKPERLKDAYERCKFYDLVEQCVEIKGRPATDEEIKHHHSQELIDLMKSTEAMTTEEHMQLAKKSPAIYYHKNVNKAARWSLGSCIEMLDSVVEGRIQNGFAMVRPPGHHASSSELPNGCCYFNNAALCAKVAVEKHKLKRVMIVDWDVHHGQGTQRVFYDNSNVLYCSIHRYDFGTFWPKLRESDFDYIGEGAGRGFNINIPLNKPGFGNSDYLAIFNNIILPVAYEFNPELIIISSGYDSCLGCFSGRMKVTPSCYAHFINSLACLANGKLLVLLEGGYNVKALSEGAAITLRALLGQPCPRIGDLVAPDQMIIDVAQNLKAVLRPFWHCFMNLNETTETRLEEYLLKIEEKRSGIVFINEETRPKEYPLTFGNVFTKEEAAKVDEELDKVIASTNLNIKQTLPVKHTLNFEPSDLDGPEVTRDIIELLVETVNNETYSKTMSRKTIIGVPNYGSFDLLTGINHSIESLKMKQDLKKYADSFGRSELTFLIIDFGKSEHRHESTSDRLMVSLNCEHLNVSCDGSLIDLPYDPSKMDDADYIHFFLHVILPIAYQYNPDFVAIIGDSKSAVGDTQGNYKLKPQGFATLCKMLQSLADGNILLAFKDTDVWGPFVYALDYQLNIQTQGSLVASENACAVTREAVMMLKPYWSALKFDGKLPTLS